MSLCILYIHCLPVSLLPFKYASQQSPDTLPSRNCAQAGNYIQIVNVLQTRWLMLKENTNEGPEFFYVMINIYLPNGQGWEWDCHKLDKITEFPPSTRILMGAINTTFSTALCPPLCSLSPSICTYTDTERMKKGREKTQPGFWSLRDYHKVELQGLEDCSSENFSRLWITTSCNYVINIILCWTYRSQIVEGSRNKYEVQYHVV
jgi:hypothetical protein